MVIAKHLWVPEMSYFHFGLPNNRSLYKRQHLSFLHLAERVMSVEEWEKEKAGNQS